MNVALDPASCYCERIRPIKRHTMGHQMEATAGVMPHWNATLQCSVDDSDSSSTVIGVLMGLVASVGINSGQNLQALGLSVSEEVRSRPYTSKTWCLGMAVFITGSMLNFAAFSFAASSILVPLEAVQFVTNVGFNKFVNKKVIPTRMLAGVALAVSGVALSVVFGSTDVRCFTIDELIDFWAVALWWIYLILTLVIAAAAYAVHRRYAAADKAQRPLAKSQYVLPVTFAVYSSLVGGANMIVHSKAVAELFELQTAGVAIFASWYFYLEFSLLSVTGCIWLYKMNESLGLYDPLFIIPLLQSSYILFGVISGGIFFQEFAGLHNGPAAAGGWPLFILGMLMILYGLYLIAPEQQSEGTVSSPRTAVPTTEKADHPEVHRLHVDQHSISMEVVLENPLVEDPAAGVQTNNVHLTKVSSKTATHTRSSSLPHLPSQQKISVLHHTLPMQILTPSPKGPGPPGMIDTVAEEPPHLDGWSPHNRPVQAHYDDTIDYEVPDAGTRSSMARRQSASDPGDLGLTERV